MRFWKQFCYFLDSPEKAFYGCATTVAQQLIIGRSTASFFIFHSLRVTSMRDLFKSVAIMKERFTSIWTQDACMGYTSLLSHLSKVKAIILTQPDQQRKQACRVPQLGNDGITHRANLRTSWHGGGKTSQEANKDQNLGSLHHCCLPRCCQSWGIGKKASLKKLIQFRATSES